MTHPAVPVWNVLATEPQYVQHLRPVFERLVPRGTFWSAAPSKLTGPLLVGSAKDYAIARRHRVETVVLMEHGTGQSYAGDRRLDHHPSYAGGAGYDRAAAILAPNGYSAARWRASYPSIPVHIIGATRLLPEPSGPPLLVVSFHWSGAIPEQRNAVGHYRRGLASLGVPVAGHAHPRFASSARRMFEKVGIPFIADIEEVARRATVYAVDNSSTLWELGLSRPVIALNAPWYRREVRHGLRFWSHVPLSVDGPDELAALARLLMSSGEPFGIRETRLSMCRDVIPYLDGARRAARLLSAMSIHPDCVEPPATGRSSVGGDVSRGASRNARYGQSGIQTA